MTAARETVGGVSIRRHAHHPPLAPYRFIAVAIVLACLSHPPDTFAQATDAQPRPTSPTTAEDAAFAELRERANAGETAAQRDLAMAYDLGQGMPQDYALSAEWYRKAAEQGDSAAQYNLGVAYDLGQGVAQDFVQSARWYRKAAEQGHIGAQHNLGVAYANGEGLTQDYVEAYKWFTIVAAGSSGEEQQANRTALDAVAMKMTASHIAEGQKRAREWLEAFARRRVA